MNLNISNTLNEGISAQNNGQFQEAARLYRIVLSSEPNNSDAYHNLGIISLVYSKIDEALINFKNAIVNNPKIEQFWISYIQTLIKVYKKVQDVNIYVQTLITTFLHKVNFFT